VEGKTLYVVVVTAVSRGANKTGGDESYQVQG